MPDYIDAHLADRFTLTDLAGVACLSPYHFSGSFSSALRHAMSGSSAIDADLTTIFAPPSRSNVRIGTLHHDARQPAFVRADSRTGVRSYIPLMHMPPLMMSTGKPKSRGQSVASATAARCPPEDWPPIWIWFRSIPRCAALSYPGDGATDLIGEHHEAAADVLHTGEVRHDIMRAGGEEHLGRGRELLRLRAAAAPGAPVETKTGAVSRSVR